MSILGNICIVQAIGCSVKLVNFTNHKFPDMETDRSEINCTDFRAVTTMRHLRQLPPRYFGLNLTTHLLFHRTAVLPNFGCC